MGKWKAAVEKIRKRMMSKKQYAEYLRKKGTIIGESCDIEKSAFFGNEPWLIQIGDNTRITRGVEFITHDGGLWTLRKMGLIPENEVKLGKIVVGKNCDIGWNAIIMPNVKIGDNCVIAAGAVVTKDVPSGEIWGGVPAHYIESIEEYYHKAVGKTVPTLGMSEEEKRKYLTEHEPRLFETEV